MRMAICLNGQPRGFPHSVNFIREYLIDSNETEYEIDLFCHAWFSPTLAGESCSSSIRGQENRVGYYHPQTEQLISSLNPTGVLIQEPQLFEFADQLEQANTCIQSEIASMYYSVYMSNELKKRYEKLHNFSYDLVLNLRYDLWYNVPIVFREYQEEVDSGFVCVGSKFQKERENPSFHGGYTLTNMFTFGSSETMDMVTSVYRNFSFLNTRIHPRYPENYFGYNAKILHQLRVKMIDIEYEILHRKLDVNRRD